MDVHPIAAATLFIVANASAPLAPFTTNNDDSCDIAVAPAATLLLPYFEVAVSQPRALASSTLVTVVNTSAKPRMARVTLWTDWAYPIMTFNLTMGGYGVESLDLYDVLVNGTIARNHNGGCESPVISESVRLETLRILTTGLGANCPNKHLGGVHANAIGYATIDVVANCGYTSPADASYYKNDLLYDNVLIGDYELMQPGMPDAVGTPLVHVRAVPEGGRAGEVVATNLPFTFYDRFAHTDRRQPLPSTFAARYFQAGDGDTRLIIWREGLSMGSCSYAANSAMPVSEFIRFDQHENATAAYASYTPYEGATAPSITLPAASALSTSNTSVFPPMSTSGDNSGWLFLNLTNGGGTSYSASRPGFSIVGTPGTRTRSVSQNWVVTRMANNRYATMFDAVPLGNGCSAPVEIAETVGPSGHVAVCPSRALPCGKDPRYFGTNDTP